MTEPRTEAGKRLLAYLFEPGQPDDDLGLAGDDPEPWVTAILAIEAEAGSLDAAWAEAEAALPEGWMLYEVAQCEQAPGKWLANASHLLSGTLDPRGHPHWDFCHGEGPTPASALHELAARLSSVADSEETA